MKIQIPARFALLASATAAMLVLGCSQNANPGQTAAVTQPAPAPAPTVVVVPAPASAPEAPMPVTPVSTPVTTTVVAPVVAPVVQPAVPIGPAATVAPDTGSPTWSAIENLTFEQRAAFISGLNGLVSKLNGQISALNVKRSTMTTDTTDWDIAMKDVTESRDYLVGLVPEVAKASPDTWGQEKDKVGGAWHKAQDACDKVRMSTTS